MKTTDFASTDSRWGLFLHRRPLAALVSGWFFAHAGDAGGHTVVQLSEAFQTSVDANDWSADAITGDGSPLESQDWWSDPALTTDLAALGARHVVMGHDPNAFGEQGEIGAHFAGRLVHIDCGMTPTVDHSKGRLLHVSNAGTPGESAAVISHSGKADALDLTAP